MIITLNALSVCAVYIMDRISPEMICSIRVIPRRNPMFHINEIEDGEGRSIRELFIILSIGLFFILWFFIRMMWTPFGLDGAHELIAQSLLKSELLLLLIS
jgi:hypothetical protein